MGRERFLIVDSTSLFAESPCDRVPRLRVPGHSPPPPLRSGRLVPAAIAAWTHAHSRARLEQIFASQRAPLGSSSVRSSRGAGPGRPEQGSDSLGVHSRRVPGQPVPGALARLRPACGRGAPGTRRRGAYLLDPRQRRRRTFDGTRPRRHPRDLHRSHRAGGRCSLPRAPGPLAPPAGRGLGRFALPLTCRAPRCRPGCVCTSSTRSPYPAGVSTAWRRACTRSLHESRPRTSRSSWASWVGARPDGDGPSSWSFTAHGTDRPRRPPARLGSKVRRADAVVCERIRTGPPHEPRRRDALGEARASSAVASTESGWAPNVPRARTNAMGRCAC